MVIENFANQNTTTGKVFHHCTCRWKDATRVGNSAKMTEVFVLHVPLNFISIESNVFCHKLTKFQLFHQKKKSFLFAIFNSFQRKCTIIRDNTVNVHFKNSRGKW